jgi:hypothetical protein
MLPFCHLLIIGPAEARVRKTAACKQRTPYDEPRRMCRHERLDTANSWVIPLQGDDFVRSGACYWPDCGGTLNAYSRPSAPHATGRYRAVKKGCDKDSHRTTGG